MPQTRTTPKSFTFSFILCLRFQVYEDYSQVGKFELTGMAPAPAGVPQVEVTFTIDGNGILHLAAQDSANNNIVITQSDKIRLSPEDIERMKYDAGFALI